MLGFELRLMLNRGWGQVGGGVGIEKLVGAKLWKHGYITCSF